MAAEDIKKDLKKQKNDIITPADFVNGETAINLTTPEPWLKRKQAVEAAKKGYLPVGQSQCPHPVSRATWMVDYVNEADRIGRPTNWFECEQCHATLFLVDGFGKAASDG